MSRSEVLAGFQPEAFRRKDLGHCWLFPSQAYWYQLDAYTAWLEKQVRELREQLGKSGNKHYQRDAAVWGQKWQEKCIEVGELKAENRRKELEIGYLQEHLEQLREELKAYQEAEEPQIQRKRNDKTGRFVSDIPKDEKVWKAWDLCRKGYNYAQIARELYVSTDTVKRYIREYEANREAYEEDPPEEAPQPWE